MVEDSPYQLLQSWKQKKYRKTNYENIHACYNDLKYIRIKPKSEITLTSGILSIVLKHPKEEKEYKLHIKNGVPTNEEKWEIDI